jgi:hypothetical protein
MGQNYMKSIGSLKVVDVSLLLTFGEGFCILFSLTQQQPKKKRNRISPVFLIPKYKGKIFILA